jgi:hypothetical protein
MVHQVDQFSPEVKTAVEQFLQRQRRIYRINLLVAATVRGIMLIAGAILLPLASVPYADILNILIAVYFLFNLAGIWAYYYMRLAELFTITLVALDTVLLGVISMWTGFLSSPFNLIFPMAAGITALVAGFRASLVTAVVCTLFMGTGAVLKMQGILPDMLAGPPLSATMIVVHLTLLLLAEWGLAMLLVMVVWRLQKGELEQVRQAGEIAAHSARLSESLVEILALKEAQDGDYF